jgi:hypothetical protein
MLTPWHRTRKSRCFPVLAIKLQYVLQYDVTVQKQRRFLGQRGQSEPGKYYLTFLNSTFVPDMAASNKVFSIFADDRNDHSKIVNQLLTNQVPVPKAKPHRPISASANAVVPKSAQQKNRSNKHASNPTKEEVNQVSRYLIFNLIVCGTSFFF